MSTSSVLIALGVMLVVALVAGIVLAEPALQAAATFLAAQDPLAPADAVIAISGNNPERVRTAAQVLLDGYARWMILSGDSRSIVQMETHARSLGVPDERILSDPNATTTLQNAHGSVTIMNSHRLRSAILVTSPYHMRRAILVFRSVFSPQGFEVRAYPAQDSIFRADGWWRRRRDREFVLREYPKLVALLFGVR